MSAFGALSSLTKVSALGASSLHLSSLGHLAMYLSTKPREHLAWVPEMLRHVTFKSLQTPIICNTRLKIKPDMP